MKQAARLVSIGEGKGVGVLGIETRRLGKATLALSVPLDSTFYADITTMNTLGAVTKDFLAAFGTYDPETGTFTMYWGHVLTGVSIPTGEKTTPVDCVAAYLGTLWDCLGGIGTYDPGTGTFTVESAMVLEDALTVTGVGVTGLSLRAPPE